MIKKRIVSAVMGILLILATGAVSFADGQSLSKSIYKNGTRHSDVQVIQEALKKDGLFTYPKFTNYYGSITENAVRSFQSKYGLFADGVAGPATIQKMGELGLIAKKSAPVVSRSSFSSSRYGKALDWWSEVKGKRIDRGSVFTVQDFETGRKFQVMMTYGTNHADIEALTKEDTQIMKEIWGGFSWARRPVLVYVGGEVIAASISNMPHAGVDSEPAEKILNSRSQGYGRGYNLDKVKNNGMDGVVDLHFKNSRRHKDNAKDSKHQSAIKVASGQIK